MNTKDTYEVLPYKDIIDNNIVCDTHLAWIIEVSGVNLFELKEEEAVTELRAFNNILKECNYPIQLITQSRDKNFKHYISEIKKTLQKNDYNLVFEKDKEWFDLYYKEELKKGTITQEQVDEKFQNAPETITRSMAESFIERMYTMVQKYDINERRHFIVISSLAESNNIDEKKELQYDNIDLTDPEIYQYEKNILNERIDEVQNLLKRTWLGSSRKNNFEVNNILYEYFQYPSSHVISDYTDYGIIPSFMKNTFSKEDEIKKGGIEKIGDIMFSVLWKMFQEKNISRNRSNETLQKNKPFFIDNSSINHLQVNDSYSFTIHINEIAWEYYKDIVLWPILSQNCHYDLAIHYLPLPTEPILRKLKDTQVLIRQSYKEKKKNKWDATISYLNDKEQEENNNVAEMESAIEWKNTKLYSLSIDITFRATSLEELNQLRKKINKLLKQEKIYYSECNANQYDWFISTCPILNHKVSHYNWQFRRKLETSDLTLHYYPFCPDITKSENWVFLWISHQWYWDKSIKNLEFFDIFDRTRAMNSIVFTIGQSWSWKTTFLQWLVKNQMLLWTGFMMIDFLWNYYKWALDMPDKFKIIKFSSKSNDCINPCDLYFPDNEILQNNDEYKWKDQERIKNLFINSKTTQLLAYYKLFLEDLYTPTTRWILDNATKKVYEKRLKWVDITSTKTINDIFFSDIIKQLKLTRKAEEKKYIQEIIIALSPYVEWSQSNMFNSPTNIEIGDHQSVVFYLKDNNEKKLKELSIMQAFLMAEKLIHQRNNNNVITIDEIHEIFRIKSEEVQSFFQTSIAEVRNLDGWVLGMTQHLDQTLKTEAWVDFYQLAVTKFFLAWWLSNNKNKFNLFNYEQSLSENSKRFLLSNNRPWYMVASFGADFDEQIQIQVTEHPDQAMYNRYKAVKW